MLFWDLSLLRVTAFMVWLGLMAALLVAQVVAALAACSSALVSTDSLVECETQEFAFGSLGDAVMWDVNCGGLPFGFAFVLAFALSLGNFVWLLGCRCCWWPFVRIVRRNPIYWAALLASA